MREGGHQIYDYMCVQGSLKGAIKLCVCAECDRDVYVRTCTCSCGATKCYYVKDFVGGPLSNMLLGAAGFAGGSREPGLV